MDKKLILAVAGSGKTYFLCNSINPEMRSLVLAFTNENINNIYKELSTRFGDIPDNIRISTFHSFLFGDCIRPYHKMICSLYREQPFKCEGLSFEQPPKAWENGKYNKYYIKQINLEHYIPHRRYYCTRMAKLINKNSKTLLSTVIQRINKFYDALYIDEYQDFRNEEYDFLSYIIKGFKGHVLLVGDYYQHSVSGKNNTGKPFGTTKKTITYNEYKKQIEKLGITIDDTQLKKTRRCSKSVCNFVKDKLGINIESLDEHNGEVVVISNIDDAKRILNDDHICKLLIEEYKSYNFKCLNWGYSKGDTYEKTCVILTDETSNIIKENFDYICLSPITRNKLYVALTRSRTDVYLMPKKIFDEVKLCYCK